MFYVKQNNLFLVERSTTRVSRTWKVLHATLFFAIAATFFLNSILLGRLFKSFQYNCILFCQNVTFEQEILPLDAFDADDFKTEDNNVEEEIEKVENKHLFETKPDKNKLNTNTVDSERRLLSFKSEESIESIEQFPNNIKEEIKTIRDNSNLSNKAKRNVQNPTENINKDVNQKVENSSFPNGTNKIEEKQENTTVIFKNQTRYIYQNDKETILVQSTLNLSKSRFPSGFLCNLALCSVLATFIWGLFFGVMMTMCSRGGKGYMNDVLSRPQNYLYWIVFMSVTFEILNFVVLSMFEKGMAIFCEEFEIFTGTKRCSSRMDPFTVQFNKKGEQMNFYLWYLIVTYTFYIGLGLIGAQILITFLRIFCVVDYQLYEVHLEDKSQTETMNQLSKQNSINIDTTTEEFASTMS